jgi:hypothetical protein
MKGSKIVVFLMALLAAPGVNLLFGGEVGFNIRYFDKRIYYLSPDPILIQVTITNDSPRTYRFKLAEDRAFSVNFNVRTTTNRPVEPALGLIRKRTENRQVYFREITIEPGESFSFVENLRDYAELRAAGSYVVEASIFPELIDPLNLKGEELIPLQSNPLGLTLRFPPLPGRDGGVPEALDEATGAALVRERLPPDEVVSYLLSARQRSQWEKFFLYLDLEAMVSRDPARQRQWRGESEEGRRRMIVRYREELRQDIVDRDIATIPTEFFIERTDYNNEEGTVVVLEKFKNQGYTERKRYTYYLFRRDNIWTVVHYTVTELGTE